MSLSDRLQHFDDYDLSGSLVLREGDKQDYAALSAHHYRAARPATMMRVLVLESTQPTLRSRLKWQQGQPLPAAVLVESLPGLRCRMRDYALSDRYVGLKDVRERALLLNAELRCISRVVVHPQWRGLGLAVRLVKAALDTATTPYTEALAAMGKVNPFFEKAGMTAYPRPPHIYDDRLTSALRCIGLSQSDLAMPEHIEQHLQHESPECREWFKRELTQWYRRNGGRHCKRSPTMAMMLTAARERLGLEPVYYLHVNDRKDATS